MELFGANGPDLDGWLASGAAKVVKSNPARTVYRVELPGTTVFVKHCKISGARAWGREIIPTSEGAARVREHPGAPRAGRGGDRTAGVGRARLALAGRELPHHTRTDRRDLLRPLSRTDPPRAARPRAWRARRQMAVALGQFVARLHDSGVAHPDPHPGNLLVETRPGRAPHFAVIDLHAVYVGQPLTRSESNDNLVLFNRWFQLRASRSDRAPSGMPTAGRAPHFRRRRRRNCASAQGTRATRSPPTCAPGPAANRACLGSNRYFRKIQMPAHFAASRCRDSPGSVPASGACRSRRRARAAGHAHLQGFADLDRGRPDDADRGRTGTVVLKRMTVRSRSRSRSRISSVRPGPAFLDQRAHALRDRCLSAHAATARGVPPLSRGPSHRGLPADRTGRGAGGTRASAEKSAVRTLARLLRAMHDRGVSHRDLKSANVFRAWSRASPDRPGWCANPAVRLAESQRAQGTGAI